MNLKQSILATKQRTEFFKSNLDLNMQSYSTPQYLSDLIRFNSKLAQSQFIEYRFKNHPFSYSKIIQLIEWVFVSMGCLISKPVFKIHSKKVSIYLFYYNNVNLFSQEKLELLMNYLGEWFGSEVELHITKLSKPYYEAHILAQSLALKSYKYRFVRLMSRLFRKAHIYKPSSIVEPSLLSGIHVTLAGRTFKQKIIPRKTVQRIQKGSMSQFIQTARYTGKTRRGAYSFTVILGHLHS